MFSRQMGCIQSPAWPTSDGLFNAAVDGQDVFVDQVHGPRPVGDLIVQAVDEASSLQLHMLGLEWRLRRHLWEGKTSRTQTRALG